MAAEGRTLWSQDAEDAPGQTLYRYGDPIGRLRYREPEAVEALNVSEAIASSPMLVAAPIQQGGWTAPRAAGSTASGR